MAVSYNSRGVELLRPKAAVGFSDLVSFNSRGN